MYDMVCRAGFEAIMIFGGDTAFGIVEAFGLTMATPLGEVAPGIAVSQVDTSLPSRYMFLITKPGGFGEVDSANTVRARLKTA